MRATQKSTRPPALPGALIRLGGEAESVQLTPGECWQLYVLLGEDAPFVRNQLSVVRNGGEGPVSLTTAEERRQVLASFPKGQLSEGLRSLKAALAELAKQL